MLNRELLKFKTNSVSFSKNNTPISDLNFSFLDNYSGNSADWVKRNLNVPIVYSVYLKPEDYLIPRFNHIEPLGKKFINIFNETLFLGHKIYGPLFNNQIRFKAKVYILFLFVLKLLVC